jgi:hypothetical protein
MVQEQEPDTRDHVLLIILDAAGCTNDSKVFGHFTHSVIIGVSVYPI